MGVMNLAEIMDRSIEILKKYVTTIIMFSIGYGVLLFAGIVIVAILGSIFLGVAIGFVKNVIFIVVIFSILGSALLALTLATNVGIIKITSQEFFEERIYASSAVGASFKSIFKVLGVTGIGLLLFIPAIGIFSVPVYFLYKSFESTAEFVDGNMAGIIIFAVIYMILILAAIAVIIGYITIFVFSLQALIVEKKGVIKSVKRSFYLVRHNFFKIYGCVILFGITVSAIQYSIVSFWGLAVSIVFMILKFFNVQESYTTFLTMALTYSNWPISLISWCVISPIGTIMISLLYFNQRFKKEGYDMTLRLKQIQKNQEREHLNESFLLNKPL